MDNIVKAMHNFDRNMRWQDQHATISFEDFLKILTAQPTTVIRNVFQVFHDMIKTYVGQGVNEYPDDPESIDFVHYDCNRLFVEGLDQPFFADRLFANRLVNLVEAMKRGAQQNKIYIFEGPHGCGKSTFLNNLLLKFEAYTNTKEGTCFETVWRLDRKLLGSSTEHATFSMLERLLQMQEKTAADRYESIKPQSPPVSTPDYVEVPCPSHDHPILMIPKDYRRSFFDDMLNNDEVKWKLFTEKEYDWVFSNKPCTICSSLYQALLNRLKNPLKVFQMLYARSYPFNRRLGEGISVFNPGDKPLKQHAVSNTFLQNRLNMLLQNGNQVKYLYSRYAKTNNGIYVLMDIKSNNTERLIELHNIISDGVHKVEEIEENVHSLFMALMNPEDKKNIKDFPSFSDRIEYIQIPYVLDIKTEVEIYHNIFGKHIDRCFLPRVLHNFARVIISTRLNVTSEGLLEWIGNSDKYSLYCDDKLQLLKMDLYTGYIPTWLSEEDRKRLTAKRRRKIIAESETEGKQGVSGRDSIKIFNEFYSKYAKGDQLINMSMLNNFFTKSPRELKDTIPEGFLDSLLRMYNYTVLHEVKESLYYYNEEQISRVIQNYLFAVNFETGSVETCKFTGDKLEITEDFFKNIETHLLGEKADQNQCLSFRKDIHQEYTSRTLTQEILMEGKPITATTIYQSLHQRYVHNLKEKVLAPFLKNENFRRAVKDYGTEAFKAYDKKIRDDITFMMNNLCEKRRYTEQGAKEVCIYVIDSELAKQA
ncbi:MAG: serine protein kinase PrkA [Proteobacteria bacterium]|nr:serine protein kinase PrkA [Pseudomonadota bacterium]